MNTKPNQREEWREKLAELAHEQWSGWMAYLFDKCGNPKIGDSATIPAEFADRWGRQMNTPYAELSEEEKNSDRIEADKYLEIISDLLTQTNQQAYSRAVDFFEIELEAWMDVHEERNRTFQTKELVKHIKQALKKEFKV